jgi:hypothetical protein
MDDFGCSHQKRKGVSMLQPRIALVVVVLVAIFFSGCGNETAQKEYEDFDPSNFDHPTTIDNQWFPLNPGAKLTFEGHTLEDGETISHRVEFVVTDLTKVIDGVPTRVVWELDYSNDLLEEAEIALFAQDNDDTVWHLGQYPEVYDEKGNLIETPAWIHGIEEARAGITMKANPQLNTPSYSQGWGPAVDWTDRAQVEKVGEQTCVPFGCFDNVLVTAETSKSEPDAFQLKYYAPGVGTVRVGWKGEDETQEELMLVDVIQLTSEQLADIRTKVLEMEQRAYEKSKDVYGKTTPME